MNTELIVDPQLRHVLVPLTKEEREGLLQSLLADGCRDALVVWPTSDGLVIVDGHTRYELCQEHGIDYRTVEHKFVSREEAMLWIVRNQMARRNLTAYQRAELVLRLKPKLAAEAKASKVRRLRAYRAGEMILKSGSSPRSTEGKLAEISGLSHDMIYKATVISTEASEEQKAALRAGETTINAVYTQLRKPIGDGTKPAPAGSRRLPKHDPVLEVQNGIRALTGLCLGIKKLSTNEELRKSTEVTALLPALRDAISDLRSAYKAMGGNGNGTTG